MKITTVGAIRSSDPTEIVALLIDDEDSAYVYGLYRSVEAAETALRAHLIERFGQEAVEEAGSDEEQGLAGLLSYTIEVFRYSAILDMINALRAADLREQHGGLMGEHPDFPKSDWRHAIGSTETTLGYWDWLIEQGAGLRKSAAPQVRGEAIVDMINAHCVADLREQHGGIWGEHPDYPRCDWRSEVANDETSQGYWWWVLSALEFAEADESVGPGTPRLKLKVENAYSDGYTSELTRRVKLDRYVDEETLWEDLFCYTGDGHGIGRDVNLFCTITILESADRPELKGLTNDFG